jgi:hypothetical protein
MVPFPSPVARTLAFGLKARALTLPEPCAAVASWAAASLTPRYSSEESFLFCRHRAVSSAS